MRVNIGAWRFRKGQPDRTHDYMGEAPISWERHIFPCRLNSQNLVGLTENVGTLGLQAARKNHCVAAKRRARKAKVVDALVGDSVGGQPRPPQGGQNQALQELSTYVTQGMSRAEEKEEVGEMDVVSTISFIHANLQHNIAASRVIYRRVSVKGIDMALIQEPWYREGRIRDLNIPGYNHMVGHPRCVFINYSWLKLIVEHN
jgi:hypothetical protein